MERREFLALPLIFAGCGGEMEYQIQPSPRRTGVTGQISFGLSDAGLIRAGQSAYNTGAGFWLGVDSGIPKFSIGNPSGNYLTWDGSTLSIVGTISVGSLDLSFAGWIYSGTWSVSDADTVAWGSGTLTTSDGGSYSITGSNTGNMAARTYIYFDEAVSTTAFQTTTTPATAIGAGKILIAVAVNGTNEASFTVLDGRQTNIDGSSIATASITANEIVAQTITTNEIAANTIVGGNISSLSISGKTITADTGTIGGWTLGANSLTAGSGATTVGLDTTSTGADDIRIYAGNSTPGSAPFRVTEAGAVTASDITITGGSVATSVLSGTIATSNTDIANNNWAYSGTWSVTDADTIAWGSGTLTVANGDSFSITGSNTGNMAAKTYVYFDEGVSTTAFQTTTTASTAVGTGKILIAICQNGTDEASYIVVNDKQTNIDAANIVAGSITANELAAGSVTAGKINVSQLSAIAADMGALTAGTITLNASGNIKSGQTDYNTGSGFWLGFTGGATKFSIGNPDTTFMTWDGTVLTLGGAPLVREIIPSPLAITIPPEFQMLLAENLEIEDGASVTVEDGGRLAIL